MQDFIPLGTGNSRYLKSVENFKTLYPTYDAFVAALVAGTLPIDFNGINEAGIAQKGNPINKNTLLKDPTAEAFGVGIGAVPDDVLRVLSRFQKGLGNEYVWARNGITTTYKAVVKEQASGTNIFGSSMSANVYTYSDAYTVNQNTGEIELTNPQTIALNTGNASTVAAAITNKYFKLTNHSNYTGVYYCYLAETMGTTNQVSVNEFDIITTEATTSVETSYVNSPDPNAYPPAVDDGYTYTALGMLGEKTKIAFIKMVGTGTYGSSNPTTLISDFPIKRLFYLGTDVSGTFYSAYQANSNANDNVDIEEVGTSYSPAHAIGYGCYMRKSADAKELYWYNDSNADRQLNYAGYTYHFMIIG